MSKSLALVVAALVVTMSSAASASLFYPYDRNETWPTSTISVCWWPGGPQRLQASSVRAGTPKAIQIQNTVMSEYARTGLQFTGWGDCDGSETFVIRIIAHDDCPSPSKNPACLGDTLPPNPPPVGDGDTAGLVSWMNIWQKGLTDQSLASTINHEFGHALGLDHENNRSDTPVSCGVHGSSFDTGGFERKLGPYDSRSIMNVCRVDAHPELLYSGQLSTGDVIGLNHWYGWPGTYTSERNAFGSTHPFRYYIDPADGVAKKCLVTEPAMLDALLGVGNTRTYPASVPSGSFADAGYCAWPPGLYQDVVTGLFYFSRDSSLASCTVADDVQLQAFGGSDETNIVRILVGIPAGALPACAGGYPSRQRVFRMHNPFTGAHYYTSSLFDYIIHTWYFWSPEAGGDFFVEAVQNFGRSALLACTVPSGASHISPHTYDLTDCVDGPASLGNAWLMRPSGMPSSVDRPGAVPLFGVFNPTTGDHLYTTSLAEALLAVLLSGYVKPTPSYDYSDAIVAYVYPDAGNSNPVDGY